MIHVYRLATLLSQFVDEPARFNRLLQMFLATLPE
jgi:hypothetical protein